MSTVVIMPTRHVLPARREHAASVLAVAFADDPFTSWLFPDPDSRPEHLATFMGLVVERATCVGHGYEIETGAGAAMWCPPGVDFFDDAMIEKFGALLAAANGDRLGVILEGLGQIGGFHPEAPHFYLNTIGVAPEGRGQGLGRLLLDRVLAVCDAEGIEAYLESSNPRNISLYERAGFTVLEEVAMPENGPVIRPMLRPPQ
ncbi:MAG: GNAT family N-acetyltransferase [Acidimicrobiales bacterium]|nr:GNAT family N-acetyltransferase [Acidimicrobiales bacterium]